MERTKPHAFARVALALILAIGLMLPMQSLAFGTPTDRSDLAGAPAQAGQDQPGAMQPEGATEQGEQPVQAADALDAAASAAGGATAADATGGQPGTGTGGDAQGGTLPDGNESPAQDATQQEGQPVTPLTADQSFTVQGGTQGKDYAFSGSKLVILSSTPLTVSTKASTTDTIEIAAGVHANLTLAGVTIQNASAPAINLITNIKDTASGAAATDGTQIRNQTSLYLTLADGSVNTLTTVGASNNAGIRCGEGSVLTIDDALDNRLKGGGEAQVEGEKLVNDVTLVGGKTIAAGTRSTELDSDNPGKLNIVGGGLAPGIGGSPYENGGTMTFNGGILDVRTYGWNFSGEGGASYSAGIGAAGSADGTATVMTFNGGTINAYGGLHGAGIGAGHSGHDGDVGAQQPNSIKSRGTTRCTGNNPNVAGNITINGGYLYSHGGWHGGAFGSACWSSNKGKTIKVTGGTLIPIPGTGGGGAHTGDYAVFPEIGGSGGYVQITGGSVRCSDPNSRFQGIGRTAWSNDAYSEPGYNVNDANDPNKVFMVKIDLSSEIKKKLEDGSTIGGNNLIATWELLVAGDRYEYGAPQQFDDGKLYLWLPKAATTEQVTVNLTYYDENGNTVAIEPLFRNPGDIDTLKRYVEFELPEAFAQSLTKKYDGLPFTAHDIANDPVTTEEVPAKILNDPGAVSYVYQPYDKIGGTHLGPEISDGGGLPSNEGIMRLTMTSTQFSDEEEDGFRENYWGHRAFGWCVIEPVPSQVKLVEAEWTRDGAPGHDEHDARQEIAVTADIAGGFFDDDPEKPVADTCKAPTGSVQIYIDDEPVGKPVPLRFAPETLEDGTVLPANATEVPNGKGGSYTRFHYVFTPADSDFHVPNEADDSANSHKVSVKYLRGMNYFESANPDEDEKVPSAEVRIKPVDPGAVVDPDPTNPPKKIETGTPTQGDDGFTEITGSMVIQYVEPTQDNPHPGLVKLGIKTPSSAPVVVVTEDGQVITAQLESDADGNPIRGEDGTYEVLIDPLMVGKTKLLMSQLPNGAYTGTRWSYDVKVLPDPGIDPKPAAAKKAVNLTHPTSPIQPGDRIHFELTASNTAKGSVWKSATASDLIPAGLTIDPASVRLANKADGIEQALTQASGPTALLGQFALTPGAGGRIQISAPVGDVGGGSQAVLSFDCVVDQDAVGLDITNVGEFKGSRLDPDDVPKEGEEHKTIPDPKPTPTNPAAPEVGPRVVPGDSASGDLKASKQVANLTHPKGDRTHLGDKLRYTITLANNGAANSSVNDVLVSDPLPKGLDFVPGSAKLTDAAGATHKVPDSAWHAGSRTLAVYGGDIPGGAKVTLTFDVKVTPDALGASAANVAKFSGDMPSKGTPESHDPGTPGPDPADNPGGNEPGGQPGGNPDDPSNPDKPGSNPGGDPDGPNDPGNNPGDPDDPNNPGGNPDDPGTDPDQPTEFVVLTPEATPTPIVPDDPGEGDVTTEKTAQNLTRQDGTTHVGDTVRYTIVVSNAKEHTAWINLAIRDQLPEGLEPLAGSIKLTLADGTQASVADAAYDRETRTLSVTAGDLPGGMQATLIFDALVTQDAVGADIGNTAQAYGELPSRYDLDEEKPKPGNPVTPNDPSASGWDAWSSDRATVKSPVAYAPGTNQDGGVVDGGDGDQGTTPGNGDDDGNGTSGVDDGLADGTGADAGTDGSGSLAKTADDAPSLPAVALLALLAAVFAGAAWRSRPQRGRA